MYRTLDYEMYVDRLYLSGTFLYINKNIKTKIIRYSALFDIIRRNKSFLNASLNIPLIEEIDLHQTEKFNGQEIFLKTKTKKKVDCVES